MKRFVIAVSAIALLGGAGAWRWAAAVASPAAARLAEAPKQPDLGVNTDLHGARFFPPGDIWNTDISTAPVDPLSEEIIKEIGADKPLHGDFGSKNGIPYTVVDHTQKKVPIKFTWPAVSNPGPYPIPLDAPIEGGRAGGDRHVLVIDRDSSLLYELYQGVPNAMGWSATCGAVFSAGKSSAQRPDGETSADAAGLAIFPGLVRYDEVVIQKKIEHAIRFTVKVSRKAHIPPARHDAAKSTERNVPPMGMRVRLKADFDISKFPDMDQVILTALKHYGMVLADNGSDWFITGSPEPRWDDGAINQLHGVSGKDFEVIRMGR